MAIFGEGMTGEDPLAKARANAQARARKRTASNIARLGEGSGAFDKGVIAAGAVGGEWLAHGIAKMFGGGQGVDPEVQAAADQANLIQEINEIEGDPSSAEYARTAGELAMKHNRQDIAHGFLQESGTRRKAEEVAASKAAAEQKKVYLDGYKAQSTQTKLAILGSGDDNAYNALNIPPGEQRDQMIKESNASLDTIRAKNAKDLQKINESRSTSTSAQEYKATDGWLNTKGLEYDSPGWSGMKPEEIQAGVSSVVAPAAKLLMVQAEEAGAPISQNEANELAFMAAVESGRLITEVSDGTGWFSSPEGTMTITGFGDAMVAPKPASDSPASGTGKRKVNLMGK